jgi:hypothetical protein
LLYKGKKSRALLSPIETILILFDPILKAGRRLTGVQDNISDALLEIGVSRKKQTTSFLLRSKLHIHDWLLAGLSASIDLPIQRDSLDVLA